MASQDNRPSRPQHKTTFAQPHRHPEFGNTFAHPHPKRTCAGACRGPPNTDAVDISAPSGPAAPTRVRPSLPTRSVAPSRANSGIRSAAASTRARAHLQALGAHKPKARRAAYSSSKTMSNSPHTTLLETTASDAVATRLAADLCSATPPPPPRRVVRRFRSGGPISNGFANKTLHVERCSPAMPNATTGKLGHCKA